LLIRHVREKLRRIAETVLAEGWNWVVVEPEFDYQEAAVVRIEAFSKELTDEEEQKLASLQDQLETLSNEAEQVGPADDTCAEAETPQAEIEALTEEVWRPEDIARAGVFAALGREGAARIERGYLRAEDVRSVESSGNGEADPKAETVTRSLSAALVGSRPSASPMPWGRQPRCGRRRTMPAIGSALGSVT